MIFEKLSLKKYPTINMAILEHKRELVPPIEVKSKLCSGFIFRIVDILKLLKKLLKKHTIKFRTTKKYIEVLQ